MSEETKYKESEEVDILAYLQKALEPELEVQPMTTKDQEIKAALSYLESYLDGDPNHQPSVCVHEVAGETIIALDGGCIDFILSEGKATFQVDLRVIEQELGDCDE